MREEQLTFFKIISYTQKSYHSQLMVINILKIFKFLGFTETSDLYKLKHQIYLLIP